MNNAKNYYNKHSEGYAKKWSNINIEHDSPSYFYRKKLMDTVLEMSNIQNGDKVVEIGCGTGLAIREILKYTRPVFGVDTSYAMLERVKDSTLKDKKISIVENFSDVDVLSDVILCVNDFEKLNLPKNYFDKLLSIEVLRYIDNIGICFRNCKSVMKDNSIFVFTITNTYSFSFFPFKYNIRKLFGLVNLNEELLQYFVTERVLKRGLEKAGLEIVDFERVGFLFMNPLVRKYIKNRSSAEKIHKLDEFFSKIPFIRAFFDTFIVAVKKSSKLKVK